MIEVAAGLSPRGWRFTRRYGERLVYVEADLPGMAERKRAALERIGSLGERHRVSEVDVLRDDDGPGSLAAVAGELDPGQGLAIVTEGLLGYLPSDAVAGSGGGSRQRWASSPQAATSRTCTSAARSRPQVEPSGWLLSAFVRGRVYLHFSNAAGGRTGAAGRRVRRRARSGPPST